MGARPLRESLQATGCQRRIGCKSHGKRTGLRDRGEIKYWLCAAAYRLRIEHHRCIRSNHQRAAIGRRTVQKIHGKAPRRTRPILDNDRAAGGL